MKKLITGLLAAVFMLGSFGLAHAATPAQFHISTSPDIGSNYVADLDVDTVHLGDGYGYLFASKPSDHTPVLIRAGQGLILNDNQLTVGDIGVTQINGLSEALDGVRADVAVAKAGAASATSSVADQAGTLSMFETRLTGVTNWFAQIATTTQYLATQSANGTMSSADKTKLGNVTVTQRTRVTTDGSGNYTWTFPTAYASGTKPIVSVVAEDASAAFSNVQITALSNTSVTVHAGKITSALGILSLASNASIPVDIIAVPQ